MKYLFTLFTALNISIFAIAQPANSPTSELCNFADYIPQANLVAYYPFCSNADDKSGNGHHMTVYGPFLTTDRFGRPNAAYQFDGIDDFISYSTVLQHGNDYTYSFWYKSDDISQRGDILTNGNGGANGVGFLQNGGINAPGFDGPGNKLTFYSCGLYAYSSTSTDTNSWHHVLLRCIGNNYEFLYDNTLVASGSYVRNNPVDAFYVGMNYIMGVDPFEGKIDDIAIYDRALTNQEIDTLFSKCGTQLKSNPISTTVDENDTANFFVSTFYSNATFQWQMNSGSGFVDLSNNSNSIGVNDDTLHILNAPFNMNTNSFRVIITSPGGCKDTSYPATINVNPPLGINDLRINNNSTMIYPNPSTGSFIVDVQLLNLHDEIILELHDLTGRRFAIQTVQTKRNVFSVKTNVSNGLYFLNLYDTSGKKVAQKKIVIN